MNNMIEKLKSFVERYNVLTQKIADPNVYNDRNEYKNIMKEYTNLQPIVDMYNKMVKLEHDKDSAQSILDTETDEELKELSKSEIDDCNQKLADCELEARKLILTKDENDEKNVIMEIREGAGGDEASLFAADLFRMYSYYAQNQGWSIEVLDRNDTEVGGIKEISYLIKGKNVYSKLKYESGVHRVQRVPETENQGRIHTSTCTVAVLPEQEDVDIKIEDKDLKVDTYRSGGAGGQYVNKTDSAIRMTHLPTGIVVACQQERSQLKNREKAMEIMKSKLYDYYKSQSDEKYAENRRTQIGTGDRSERIRTYNYPQGRLTDHRINYTVYNLQAFLDGDLKELIENLSIADEKAKIENAK